MGGAASVPTLDTDMDFLKETKEEYSRRIAAGDSEEQIFHSLRGLVAHHLEAGPKPSTKVSSWSERVRTPRSSSAYTVEDLPGPDCDNDSDNELATASSQTPLEPLEKGTEHSTVSAITSDDSKEQSASAEKAAAGPSDSLEDAKADDELELKASESTSELIIAAKSAGGNKGFGHCIGGPKNAFDLAQNLAPVFTTDVLTDPATLRMILKYAEVQKVPNGVDMLRFWVEIDELQHLPSHSYTHRRLHKIYDKFLSPEAPSPVCVTTHMLQEIEHALNSDNISAGIYAEAQQICFVALEKSVYPRFRESKLFRKMQDFCAPIHPNGGASGASSASNSTPSGPTMLGGASATGTVAAGINEGTEEAEDFTLLGILGHPAKLRFLKTFCMEALALENLLFYLEVEDCKRLPNLSFVINKTRKIYDRYCTPASRHFIKGLDNNGALLQLHEAVETKAALVPKLFYEVQLQVFERISDEIWRGFCRSQEYLEHSKDVKAEPKQGQRRPMARFEQSEGMQEKLEALSELQLIDTAMHYPVEKLIPFKYPDANLGFGMGAQASLLRLEDEVLTPQQLLSTLLHDPFAKKYFKLFMTRRGVEPLLAFCEEVEDFKLLPGIEFLQHSAKKIYRKYMMPSARLQVDMSTSMRDEIFVRLSNPSVDMFKKIAARVRHGMLQDSLPRFVKSKYYSELRRDSKQTPAESQLIGVDAAAKAGKLELSHLDVFLNHPGCMQAFRKFLDFQHCSENLMLWEEIEHYKRLPSYQIVLRSAKKIYDKYLNPGNSKKTAIPLASALRRRVESHLDVASRTTFDEVENECYDHMRNVIVPDFLDSRIFMALVGTWATVHEDYPAEMLRGEFEMAFLRHRFHLVQESRGMSRDSSTPLLEKQMQHRANLPMLGAAAVDTTKLTASGASGESATTATTGNGVAFT